MYLDIKSTTLTSVYCAKEFPAESRTITTMNLCTRSQNWEKRLLASTCPPVRASLCPHVTAPPPTGRIFKNFESEYISKISIDKIQVSLKSDKNNGCFTWRPIHIYDNISLSFSYDEKCFRQRCREKQNIHFTCNNFFEDRAVYEIMCKNTAETNGTQMTI